MSSLSDIQVRDARYGIRPSDECDCGVYSPQLASEIPRGRQCDRPRVPIQIRADNCLNSNYFDGAENHGD